MSGSIVGHVGIVCLKLNEYAFSLVGMQLFFNL